MYSLLKQTLFEKKAIKKKKIVCTQKIDFTYGQW